MKQHSKQLQIDLEKKKAFLISYKPVRREFGTPVKKASKAPIHPITSWLQRICVGSEQMKALDPGNHGKNLGSRPQLR